MKTFDVGVTILISVAAENEEEAKEKVGRMIEEDQVEEDISDLCPIVTGAVKTN